MPEKLVLKDVSVVVDNTTLTTSAREVDLNFSKAQLDATAFGGNGWEESETGTRTGEISVTFYMGFDASGVHATLWPLFDNDDEFTLRIGPKGDAGATDNPVVVATVKIYDYHYLQGAVNELSTNPVVFRLTGPPTLNTT